MSISQAKKIIGRYADELKREKINFRGVYLFGSYAKGRARKESDIDVAIIVNKIGSSRRYFERKMKLRAIAPKIDPRIEPILLEQQELEGDTMTIMGDQVKKTGIQIF